MTLTRNTLPRLLAAALALSSMLSTPKAVFAADEVASVTSGTGKTKFDALLQAWAVNDTSSTAINKFNFRLRRAELKFSGSVAENSRWFVMADPAKSLTLESSQPTGLTSPISGLLNASNDNKILQDFGLAYSLCPELEFTVGQFKTPTIAEGLDSSAELLFPERALVSTKFGDRRELGAQLQYKADIYKVTAMIAQGSGANTVDNNNDKDLHIRVDVKPLEYLALGAFTSAPDLSWGVAGRFGVNARFMMDDVLVRAEYAKQSGALGDQKGLNLDAGYTINEKFQPVVRYDSFVVGTADTSAAYSLGLNYFLLKQNSKVTAAYSIFSNAIGSKNSANPGSQADKAGSSQGGLFILAFQAAI